MSKNDFQLVMKTMLHTKTEGVELEPTENILTYGNQSGLSLFERFDSLERDIHNIKLLRNELNQHILRITILEAQNQGLSRVSDGYMLVRRRFIENYKRNTNTMSNQRHSEAIRQGNMAIHHDDAITDAMLMEKEFRKNDVTEYQDLYGLLPKEILTMSTFIS